jgi:calpain-15
MPTANEEIMSQGGYIGGWARMCNGRSAWYVNLLCCPFVMVYNSFWIYCFGCCLEYLIRFANTVGCFVFKLCCWWCCEHVDKAFPANASSIGPWKAKSKEQIEQEIEWKRATEVVDALGPQPVAGKPQPRVKLFEGGVEVTDIAQGGLGDCWLMSALCCMAERPGQLYKIFVQNAYSDRGKYSIRIFDGRAGKWVTVTIDDLLPVEKATGQLLYAQPKGRELWVLLLEKAFAKFCGSYADLDGGHEIWAFEALTGDPVFSLMREGGSSNDGHWVRHDLVHKPGTEKRKIGLRKSDEQFSDEQTFQLVRTYIRAEALMTASISNHGEAKRSDGLVAGHAYSLLDAKSFSGGIHLVRLRNPWGTFEWKGAWSDDAPEWKTHPKIQRLIKPSADNDGSFWMNWDDFIAHFNGLDVCNRSRGVRDLYLDLHEDDGCRRHNAGPAKGCAYGCFLYWFCCEGVKALYCGKVAGKQTLKPHGGHDDSMLSQMRNII